MTSIQKQQFQNMSGGHLGVVVIGPKGVETGIPVPPDGFVWLSEEEQILTANAPRSPKDNPFTEKTRSYIDSDTGEAKTETYTPLVPSSEERFVPSQARYVPGTLNDVQSSAQAAQAATASEPTTVLAEPKSAETRAAEIREIGDTATPGQPVAPPPVPSRAAAAAAATQEPSPTPAPPQETPAPPPAPQEPQEAPTVPEETAAAVDPEIGEETGAAEQPITPPSQGSYAAGEEVGTPDAPAQPAPYTPTSE